MIGLLVLAALYIIMELLYRRGYGDGWLWPSRNDEKD